MNWEIKLVENEAIKFYECHFSLQINVTYFIIKMPFSRCKIEIHNYCFIIFMFHINVYDILFSNEHPNIYYELVGRFNDGMGRNIDGIVIIFSKQINL